MNYCDIVFFRHGQTDWNKQDLFQGSSNIPLNEEGKNQARSLITKLVDVNFTCIFTSPLARAYETAKYISGAKNIPLIAIQQFQEINFGDAEGLSLETVETRFPDILSTIDDVDHSLRDHCLFPNGETRDQGRERFQEALRNIINLKQYPAFAVCSHGEILNSFIKEAVSQEVKFKNTTILYLRYDYKTRTFSLL